MIPNARKENHFGFLLPYFTQNREGFMLLTLKELSGAFFSSPKFTKMYKNKKFLCEYYEKSIFLHFLH